MTQPQSRSGSLEAEMLGYMRNPLRTGKDQPSMQPQSRSGSLEKGVLNIPEIQMMEENERSDFEKLSLERKRMKLQLELVTVNNELMQKEKESVILERSVLEQNRADEQFLKLAQDQKVEKENLQMKIVEWEKTINSKQALELEIQHLVRGNRRLKEQMDDDSRKIIDELKQDLKEKDGKIVALEKTLKEKNLEFELLEDFWNTCDFESYAKRGVTEEWEEMGEKDKKIEDLEEKLKEKDEEIESLEEVKTILMVKESYANRELIEARNELITLLREQEGPTKKRGKFQQPKIGVKRMGDLDQEAFTVKSCKGGTIILSEWENKLRDPNWHPFLVIEAEGGGHKEIIDEDDGRLKYLKEDLGLKAFEAMCTALMEINDYNPSARYPVPELWDFENKRKATLKEGISYLMNLKRKRSTR